MTTKLCAALAAGLVLVSPELSAYDYQDAAKLNSLCTDAQRPAAIARCVGYVEGVLATWVSLAAEMKPNESNKKKLTASARKYLDSNVVVEQFKRNFRAGKYSGANIGASFAVVDTALDLLRNSGKS